MHKPPHPSVFECLDPHCCVSPPVSPRCVPGSPWSGCPGGRGGGLGIGLLSWQKTHTFFFFFLPCPGLVCSPRAPLICRGLMPGKGKQTSPREAASIGCLPLVAVAGPQDGGSLAPCHPPAPGSLCPCLCKASGLGHAGHVVDLGWEDGLGAGSPPGTRHRAGRGGIPPPHRPGLPCGLLWGPSALPRCSQGRGRMVPTLFLLSFAPPVSLPSLCPSVLLRARD